MRKSLKVFLGVLGGILALCGFAWIDALRKAAGTIAQHEARLPGEIEQLRSRPTCRVLLGKSSATPRRGASFDQGWEERWTRIDDYWKSDHVPDLRFEDDLLAELAETQVATRECGREGWSLYLRAENTLLTSWQHALRTAEQDRTTLRRRFEALEALYAGRSSIRDFVTSESIIERIELLRLWHEKRDPVSFVVRSPCWRELFSWRILIAKSLVHVEDLARETQVLHGYPEGCGHPEWDNLLWEEDVHYDREVPHGWKEQGAFEISELNLWSVARAATAVALFRLERGRDPADLAELVPLYLREIPVTRPSGDRIEFQGGSVGAPQSKDRDVEPWQLFGR